MYKQETRSVEVRARPIFLKEHSSPKDDVFVWAYEVLIRNRGEQTLQLMKRYWCITDGNGLDKEVVGAGVVGQKPVLKPGESFQYSSFTVLGTPTGNMFGS